MQSDRAAPFWKTRPLCVAAGLFGLGAYWGVRVTPNLYFAEGIAALGLLALFKKTRWAAFAAFVLLGALFSSHAAHPYMPAEGAYRITGIVRGDVRVNADTGQVRAMLEDLSLDGQSVKVNGYWTYYLDANEAPPALYDGDQVTFEGRLYHPMGQSNPHGFDFKLYLNQNGMAVGLYGREGLLTQKDVGRGIGHAAYRARQALLARLKACMGEDAGLAAAMTLGERSLIPEEDAEAFRRTGTAHILSISGLHIGYLILMIMLLFKAFQVPRKAQWPVLFVFLAGYAFLTGLSAAVIRAAILALMAALARARRRPYDGLTALSAAFMGILLFRPLDILSPGFVMTFAAVLGIILLNRPIEKRLGFLPRWLCQALSVSLCASAGILIPIMNWYYQVQWLSPLINLVMVPWSGILTVLFFLTLLFPFLGGISALLTRIFLAAVRLVGQLPFLTLAALSPPWYIAVCGLMLMALYSGYLLLKGKKRLAASGAAILLMAAGLMLYLHTPPRYILFANGQGDGAILESGAYTMVVDAGENGSDMAAYLKARGRKVNALVLTHLHSDHVKGLSAFLRQGVTVDTAYLPAGYEGFEWDEGCLSLVKSLGADLKTLQKGDSLPYTKVLWPSASAPPLTQDGNALSLGLLITLENVRILTLGDLTGAYEAYAAEGCDVLKASHHGSASSSGNAFLDIAAPSAALITCQTDALLPAGQTLERFESRGIAVFRTDTSGALTLRPKKDGYTISGYLTQ